MRNLDFIKISPEKKDSFGKGNKKKEKRNPSLFYLPV
jgi:hypothetical protein